MVSNLKNKTLLLGVGGGIAAYKTPDLVRRFREAGADVQVIVTEAGQKFVSPLALEVVSGHGVGISLWGTDSKGQIAHTRLGEEADLIVLAPATANLIARLAHGFASDLLASTVLACKTPILCCPSMNTDMWDDVIVQRNLERLRATGRVTILSPGSGLLACGVTGPGRLPDPSQIIDAVGSVLTPNDLAGLAVTVSAGPTHETIDPVRFITNRSTGTMGYEIARALVHRGADVTLVSGPVDLPIPSGVSRFVAVHSAAEMSDAIGAAWPTSDALIMSAAVADVRPAQPHEHKWKKTAHPEALALERTQDILAGCASLPGRPTKLLVGFAAETQNVVANASEKLDRKRLDYIVANDVSQVGVGFGNGMNQGVLLGADGTRVELAKAEKSVFARTLIAALAPALRARGHR